MIRAYDGTVQLDLSGSWARDYSRGDDVDVEIHKALIDLQRTQAPRTGSDIRLGRNDVSYTQRKASMLLALARLADVITRMDNLSISQGEHEISVEREGDFAIFCEFHDGEAQGPTTDYGSEICGWDGDQFVSRLILPDGLRVTHRFTLSPNGDQLRIATTVSSSSISTSFSLDRFYRQFERPASEFNCIETLSMNRVCSTGEIKQ